MPRTARAARAPTSSIAATSAEPRAMRAGQPSRGGERRDRHPERAPSTPSVPIARARGAVPASAAGARRASTRCTTTPTREPDGLAECRDENEEQHRDRDAVVGARSAERGDDARDEADTDRPDRSRLRSTRSTRATKPSRQPPMAAPTAKATMTTTSSAFTAVLRRRREQSGVGEEAGVRDHPVVGPDRLALDVPACVAALRAISTIPNGASASSSRSRPTCRIVGRYATRMPPGRSASIACFTTRHGSGRSSTTRSRSRSSMPS